MRKYLLVAGFLAAALPAYAQTTYQGGAGGSVATTSAPGTVQPDGVTITVDGAGVITAVTGGGGDVVGPASATADHVVAFDGTTGKLIKGGGIATSALVTLTGTQTLTNKTLTSPIVTGTLLSGSAISFNGPGGFARTHQFYTSAGTQFGRHSADALGPNTIFTKSRHATVGSHTAVVAEDNLNNISTAGSDGTSYVVSTQVLSQVGGTVSTGIVPGRIAWWTMNAAGSMLERMRLSASGGLHIGVTPTDPGVNNISVQGSVTAANATLTGIVGGTQDRCLGLTSGNSVVSTAGACGAGGSVSVTAATSNIVVTPSPGTGTFTVGTTAPLRDASGSGVAIVAADNTKTVLLGAFTYTLAQAGTAGFESGWGTCLLNVGATAATVNATTSVFKGAGGTTSLSLLPGTTACPTSNGTDYVTLSASGAASTGTGSVVRATGSAVDLTNATGLPAAQVPAAPTAAGTTRSLTGPREYWVCTGTCTVTPPAPVAGYEFCVMNGNNVATVITMAALGSSAMYENTARTAYGTAGTGTLVSGAAAANKVCLLGLDSTHYLTISYNGSWTAN